MRRQRKVRNICATSSLNSKIHEQYTMKALTYIFFFIGLFILIVSYFIVPYKVHEDDLIVIDADVVGFLKMLYALATIIFGCLFISYLRIYKNKGYLILSFILLTISLFFLCKMFFYFDKFLD